MFDNSPAIENAKRYLEVIREYAAAKTALCGGADSAVFQGEKFDSEDYLQNCVDQIPVSVRVREDWRPACVTELYKRPCEYEIMLCDGMFACRIIGEVDALGAPFNATLQWQNWHTGWVPLDVSDDELDALDMFTEAFYYGEPS